MSVKPSPYVLSNEEIVFNGRWMKTRQVKYRCPDGSEGVWQSAHRTTRPVGSLVDGVDIMAILKKDGKRHFIFVKQYRIPVGGWCLEFPAGLIDENETTTEAAIRELKEETGYTASQEDIVHCSSGAQHLDPGLSDDSVQFVMVTVDGDLPENKNPEQILGDSEVIEVVLVECDRVMEYFKTIETEIHIEAMVYSFAMGWTMNNTFK